MDARDDRKPADLNSLICNRLHEYTVKNSCIRFVRVMML